MIVVEKIREHALATPDKVAVVFNNDPVDYPTFYRRIMAVRGYLLTFGLRPGAVGVAWVGNILDGWVINLALRSLGLVTLAAQSLDEMNQFDRLDLGCIVLSGREPAFLPAAAPASVPVIRVPVEALDAAGGLDGLPPAPGDDLDGGHILLTSGTTGLYKKMRWDPAWLAPALERGLQLARDGQAVGAGPGKRVVNLGAFGLWTAVGYGTAPSMWATGSTIVIYQAPEPWRVFDWPGITSTWVTPNSLRTLLDAPEGALTPNPEMALVIVGGAVSAAMARRARERLTPRVTSALAATEAGTWGSTPLVEDDDVRLHKLVATRAVEVLDEAGQPAPVGELGELRVKLLYDTATYYDDPDATARFLRDGWFYPGDLARLHPDGRLSLHGRVTDVIAIHGDKHAAEPFERDLIDRLDVDDACVFSMPSADGDQLHVVLQTTAPPEPEAVTKAIEAVLFGFTKAIVHVVEEMPRNHMGKVQRLKLKLMLMSGAARPTS